MKRKTNKPKQTNKGQTTATSIGEKISIIEIYKLAWTLYFPMQTQVTALSWKSTKYVKT